MKKMLKINCLFIVMALVITSGMKVNAAVNIVNDDKALKAIDKEKYRECEHVLNSLNREDGESSALADRYGIDIDLNSDNTYTIKIDDFKLSRDLKKEHFLHPIRFKVIEISFLDVLLNPYGTPTQHPIEIVSKAKSLTVHTPIKVKRPTVNTANSSGYGITEIKLASDRFDDPQLKKYCNYSVEGYKFKDGSYSDKSIKNGEKGTKVTVTSKVDNFEITISAEDGGSGSEDSEDLPSDIVLDTAPEASESINCSGRGLGAFERKFCEAKSKAEKVSSPQNLNPLTCDVKNLGSGASSSDESYFANKKYYTYTSTKTHESAYVNNYECGTKTTPISCKVTCEEVVTVEYGPPVATKAGLCFEYKIRVTSRVNCHSNSNIPKPPKYTGYCTPTPSCAIKVSRAKKLTGTHRQGGPSEDFDACVKKCDKGKYTDKCSIKCYKEVYMKSLSKSTGTEISYDTNSSAEVEQTANKGAKYGFLCNDYKQIYWYNGNNNFENTKIIDFVEKPVTNRKAGHDPRDPRWYWGIKGGLASRYGCYKNTGIPAACGCKEKCLWVGCTGDKYLNPADPHKVKGSSSNVDYIVGNGVSDYKKNVEAYNTLKKECKKQAICKTETSEYTISVKYNDKWYNFPSGKSNTGTLPVTGNGTFIKGKTNNQTPNGVVQLVGGCYKYDDTIIKSTDKYKESLYQTEWTFPGTWLNNKTGELSYTPKGSGYVEKKNKFCLPLNQQNVNSKWWNYYYTKKMSGLNSSVSSGTAFDQECVKKSGCNWKVNDVNTSDINWNIIGETKKFGYYDWHINVKCFYATNNNICDPLGKGNVSNDKCKSGNKKIIRTVDLKQLFPAGQTTDASNPAKTTRNPGYNWSVYATDTKTTSAKSRQNTGADFDSKPSAYTRWVQKKNYKIYSDRYLDYQVDLTREKIRTIKNQMKNGNINYSAYSSTINEVEGDVIHYKSSFLRNVVGATVPKYESALRCNNMKNYNEAECEIIEGEG